VVPEKSALAGEAQSMKNLLDYFWVRDKHVCPWWLCFTFDNFLRRLFQNPEEIIKPYVSEGDTVLDAGPGMGYFSIPLAKIVGEKGRVTAADVQLEMLHALQKRAQRAGVEQRITFHLCKKDFLGLDIKFDFALAFWMVHEVPEQESFFKEIKSLMKPHGKLLMSEPTIHVTKVMYDKTVEKAIRAGFILKSNPKIWLSRSALLGME
jgi:ubiquinone/menaquinone biosynthesis C-methylase UbiE